MEKQKKFYVLHYLRNDKKFHKYYFGDADLEGEYVPSYMLSDGEELMPEDYPDRYGAVYLPLDIHYKDYYGEIDGTVLGNTGRWFILKNEAANSILNSDLQLGKVQVLPIQLRHPQNNSVIDGYSFFNPIGVVDVMHKASEYWRSPNGDQCLIEKAYLDAEKLTTAPDVFRMCECDPTYIVFSEAAKDFVEKQGYTNFLFTELEVK